MASLSFVSLGPMDFTEQEDMADDFVYFPGQNGGMSFENPLALIRATRVEDVIPALRDVEAHLAQGKYAAGYISYEAAPAFDDSLEVHTPLADAGDLLWFMICEKPHLRSIDSVCEDSNVPSLQWTPQISQLEYIEALAEVHSRIAAGETYQTNFSFSMKTDFGGSATAWFAQLYKSQPTEFAAMLHTSECDILSVSPELFFRLDGQKIESRPMKGTRPRGRWPGEDLQMSEELSRSEKDLAENVMIVDLIRNDLGRISHTGTVKVKNLFTIERHPTVWQMTTTVAAETSASLCDIFKAIFPCGSVTGAPKTRTMHIIKHLETEPRGVYCGAIGWCGPGRQACFNVPIRTVVVDRENKSAIYHTGSGITWDSHGNGEYQECLGKTAVLTPREDDFQLLETMLYEKGQYVLLDEHLRRLTASASYFDFHVDRRAIEEELDAQPLSPNERYRVRLLVDHSGLITVQCSELRPLQHVRLKLATEPVDSTDIFLFHKTTNRATYQHALAALDDCDDVLLWNEKREITESCLANVAFRIDDQWYTPPVKCGLLGGLFRAEMISSGRLHERVVTLEDLDHVQEIQLMNSVRGIIPIETFTR